MLGMIFTLRRQDPNAFAVAFPGRCRFFQLQHRTVPLRHLQMRSNTAFGKQNPGARLPNRNHFIR
ncbi:MAG: hypothetical protein ALAOOOJD_04531 [bacterium]|nr:hypothetical protein [bacterium]